MKVEEYRQEYASFNEDLLREFYLHYSGQKQDLELGPIYERYSGLFTRDEIASLRQHLSETAEHFETARTGVRHLLSFAVNNFLEAQVEHLTEQVSGREASAGVEWDGRLMTFQETAIAIANETNRALRNDLFQIRISMIQDLNDLRAERLSKLHEASRTMRLMEPRHHSQQGSSDQFTRTYTGSPQTQPDFTADNYASLYEDLLGLNFEDLE